jgi:hypothetical protein
MEGSVLTGIAEGPEATRAILGFGVTFPLLLGIVGWSA